MTFAEIEPGKPFRISRERNAPAFVKNDDRRSATAIGVANLLTIRPRPTDTVYPVKFTWNGREL